MAVACCSTRKTVARGTSVSGRQYLLFHAINRDTLAHYNAPCREQAPIAIGLLGYCLSYLVLIYIVALWGPLWPDLMGVESPSANGSSCCYRPGCHDRRLV